MQFLSGNEARLVLADLCVGGSCFICYLNSFTYSGVHHDFNIGMYVGSRFYNNTTCFKLACTMEAALRYKG